MRIDGLPPAQRPAPPSMADTSRSTADASRPRFEDLLAGRRAGGAPGGRTSGAASSGRGGSERDPADASPTADAATGGPSAPAVAPGADSRSPAFGFDALGPFARTDAIAGSAVAQGVTAGTPAMAADPQLGGLAAAALGVAPAEAAAMGAGGPATMPFSQADGGPSPALASGSVGLSAMPVMAARPSSPAIADEAGQGEGSGGADQPGSLRNPARPGPQLAATTDGGETSVVVQAAGFDAADGPSLRQALGRAALDLGYSLNQLTLNGAAVSPASIAKGGSHGGRRGQ